MALTDTTNVMLALQIKDVAQTSRIDLLRRQVEAAVKTFCKWGLEQETVTEYYDGQQYKDVVLRNPFVSSIANVWIDDTGYYGQKAGSFANPALIAGSDYALVTEGVLSKCGLLRSLQNNFFFFPSDLLFYRNAGGLAYTSGAMWNQGYGNIKVQYTYGFPGVVSITAATWSTGISTYTTAAAHGFTVGMLVYVVGTGSFDAVGRIVAVPSTTSFTLSSAANPGTYGGAGTADCVPPDIKLAVETAVGIVRNSVKYGFPLTSENMGDYSYSSSMQREMDFLSVRHLLAPYRDTAL